LLEFRLSVGILNTRIMSDMSFARTITEMDLGSMASSVMTDCEKYGMTYGCNEDCPVLIAGKCELQDSDNKELYERALENER
jgi:hypothetical protein